MIWAQRPIDAGPSRASNACTRKEDRHMPHTKRPTKTIKTTLGELAAALYEAALAEVKDETKAAKLAQVLMVGAMKRHALA